MWLSTHYAKGSCRFAKHFKVFSIGLTYEQNGITIPLCLESTHLTKDRTVFAIMTIPNYLTNWCFSYNKLLNFFAPSGDFIFKIKGWNHSSSPDHMTQA